MKVIARSGSPRKKWNTATLLEKALEGAASRGFIYTMGMKEQMMRGAGVNHTIALTEILLARIFGASESLIVTDTYQFDDYSRYVADRFDPEKKARRRNEQFPEDCERAFEMGAKFAGDGTMDGK